MDRKAYLDRFKVLLFILILSFFFTLAAAYLLADLDASFFLAVKASTGFERQLGLIGYYMGHGSVLIPLLAALTLAGLILSKPRLKSAAGWSLAAFIISGIIAQIVKHLVGRPRPRLLDQGILHFGPTLASGLDSFPSGHTTSSVAVAAVLAYYYPKAAPLFVLAALFVAVSRVISGSHFPLDVLGGLILGAAVGLVLGRYAREKAEVIMTGEGVKSKSAASVDRIID